MHTSDIALQILVAIRGKRSQTAVSRSLGFDYNQVYRWEKGITRISWLEFVRLCRACRINIDAAVQKTYMLTSPPEDSAALIRALTGKNTTRAVAERLGQSRFLVGRWRSGKSVPSLEQIIQLWQIFDGRLIDFIESLGIIHAVDTLRPQEMRQKKLMNLLQEFPYAGLILSILETKPAQQFKSRAAEKIGTKLGLPMESIQKILDAMVEMDILVGDNGSYQITDAHHYSTTSLPHSHHKLIRQYWLKQAMNVLNHYEPGPRRNGPVFGYLEFSANEAQLKLIYDRYLEFYQEVLAIIHHAKGDKTTVRVMNFQLFDPCVP